MVNSYSDYSVLNCSPCLKDKSRKTSLLPTLQEKKVKSFLRKTAALQHYFIYKNTSFPCVLDNLLSIRTVVFHKISTYSIMIEARMAGCFFQEYRSFFSNGHST